MSYSGIYIYKKNILNGIALIHTIFGRDIFIFTKMYKVIHYDPLFVPLYNNFHKCMTFNITSLPSVASKHTRTTQQTNNEKLMQASNHCNKTIKDFFFKFKDHLLFNCLKRFFKSQPFIDYIKNTQDISQFYIDLLKFIPYLFLHLNTFMPKIKLKKGKSTLPCGFLIKIILNVFYLWHVKCI